VAERHSKVHFTILAKALHGLHGYMSCMNQIEVVEGDITKQAVDAIVNAANTTLLGGGGVDAAIHRAAGPELLEECRRLGGCATGLARITQGYRLPAKWVIHTVGPVWRDGQHGEDELLASCYQSCFALAEEHGIRTIAFPSISTGAYGFPMERAARIAVRETQRFLDGNTSVERVVLVCFGQSAYETHTRAVKEI
jgi:O-acetyl-ADP-ribose deacetylase (regulator of RNase III)